MVHSKPFFVFFFLFLHRHRCVKKPNVICSSKDQCQTSEGPFSLCPGRQRAMRRRRLRRRHRRRQLIVPPPHFQLASDLRGSDDSEAQQSSRRQNDGGPPSRLPRALRHFNWQMCIINPDGPFTRSWISGRITSPRLWTCVKIYRADGPAVCVYVLR